MQTQTLKASPSTHPSHRRAAGFGFVAAIHVALIYALINMGIITVPFMPPKQRIVIIPLPPPVQPTTTVRPPQPGQVDTTTPKPPEPVWTYETDKLPGRGGINVAPTQAGVVATAASGIMSTHTIPPYPLLSIKLGEVGVVSLHVNVSEAGTVTEAVVIRSSGHTRLDDAAVAWVKAHWRYRPAMQAGQAVASAASAQVKFELH